MHIEINLDAGNTHEPNPDMLYTVEIRISKNLSPIGIARNKDLDKALKGAWESYYHTRGNNAYSDALHNIIEAIEHSKERPEKAKFNMLARSATGGTGKIILENNPNRDRCEETGREDQRSPSRECSSTRSEQEFDY